MSEQGQDRPGGHGDSSRCLCQSENTRRRVCCLNSADEVEKLLNDLIFSEKLLQTVERLYSIELLHSLEKLLQINPFIHSSFS